MSEVIPGKPVQYIVLSHNGDPFGRGFTGTLMHKLDDDSGIYCGNIGAQSRAWWRSYARSKGYKLVECRS